MTEPDSEFMTTAQVAQLLGVSLRTVHRAAEDRALPPAQKLPGPNGAFLFRPDDVETYRRQRRRQRPTTKTA